MKFLPPNMSDKRLMPIHVYYSRGEYGQFDDDILDFVYKDMDTGEKYVETIKNPYYEVYIVKPEFRKYKPLKDFMDIKYCDVHKVHYKTRYSEIGKILGIKKSADVKTCQYVFQMDIAIENFYLWEFKKEYGNELPKDLKTGYLDIETDMFQSDRIIIGTHMIDCVSYFDENTLTMHTHILPKDDIPHLPPNHAKYEKYENLRKSLYEQVQNFMDHIKDFIKELHDDFDESYGILNYKIYSYETETDLITNVFNIIRQCSPDFWFVWNLPFDEETMIERLKYHGIDPASVISDPEMRGASRDFYFKGDNNPKAHKRRHISNIYAKEIPLDQLAPYAGIRISKGSLQSMKLNVIAKSVLQDSKLNYGEYGDFKFFKYQNFWMYIKYNIKDVLLQYGIEKYNRDLNFIYDCISNDCVLNPYVFTSVLVETMSLRDFAFGEGLVLGNNRNKMDRKPVIYVNKKDESEDDEDTTDDEFLITEAESEEEDSADGGDLQNAKNKKKEKFSGAYVMNSKRIHHSGTKVMGRYNKYVHKHVIDYDIGAE